MVDHDAVVDETKVTVKVPPWFDTVNVPPAPTYTLLDPAAGSDKPTAAKVAEAVVAGTVTVLVVVTTPVVVLVVEVVETFAPPLMTTLVSALIAGGGVVVDPATVVPNRIASCRVAKDSTL